MPPRIGLQRAPLPRRNAENEPVRLTTRPLCPSHQTCGGRVVKRAGARIPRGGGATRVSATATVAVVLAVVPAVAAQPPSRPKPTTGPPSAPRPRKGCIATPRDPSSSASEILAEAKRLLPCVPSPLSLPARSSLLPFLTAPLPPTAASSRSSSTAETCLTPASSPAGFRISQIISYNSPPPHHFRRAPRSPAASAPSEYLPAQRARLPDPSPFSSTTWGAGSRAR